MAAPFRLPPAFGQDGRKRDLAHLEWIATQVITVQLDQVESVQKHCRVVAPVADAIELGNAALVTGHRLAIDDAELSMILGDEIDQAAW